MCCPEVPGRQTDRVLPRNKTGRLFRKTNGPPFAPAQHCLGGDGGVDPWEAVLSEFMTNLEKIHYVNAF